MDCLTTASKQNTSAATAKNNVSHAGTVMVQRKSNGCDAEALARLVSHDSPPNALRFSPNNNNHSPSAHLISLVQRAPLQARLSVGKPKDKYEQEADRVAEQVMSMPEPVVQRKPT